MTQRLDEASLPLLCRTELRPGESLLSLLSRLAGLNCYGSIQMLTRWCLGGTQENMSRPWQAATFDRIASLTNLPWQVLYDATPHRFAQVLTPPDMEAELLELPSGKAMPLLPTGMAYEQLRSSLAAQFCPKCLEESAHHSVAWFPIAVSVCLQHNCLLLDHCPDCWQPVTVQDVATSCCSRCGFDLAQASSRSIQDDAWGQFSQQVIQAWLGITPLPGETLPYSLPREPPAVIYHILDGLRQSLEGVRAEWKYLYRLPDTPQYRVPAPDDTLPYRETDSLSLLFDKTLTPAESYCLYATAFKAVVDWPRGFYEFLRAYSLRDVVHLDNRLSTDLGDLYCQWLKKSWLQVSLVQEAFHQYLVDNYALSPSVAEPIRCHSTPEFTEGPSYISVTGAARLLGTSPKTIQRLVETELLFEYKFPECCELPGYMQEVRFDFVRRIEVMELHERWANGVPLHEVSRWLGLSESVILGLVRAGFLFAERGPEVDASPCWVFSKQAVTECYYEVTRNLRQYVPDTKTIDLSRAVQILSGLEVDETKILEYIMKGRLTCYLPKDTRGLDGMVFTEGDIRAFLERSKEERGWVNHKEVSRQMGVNDSSVVCWVKSGLLSPLVVCGRTYYFDRKAVEKFVAGHVFMEEATGMAGVGEDVIKDWMRERRLRPVSGPKVDFYYRHLFRRADIERLCRESQAGLTEKEAVRVDG